MNGKWKWRKRTENKDSNNGRILRKTEMIDGNAGAEAGQRKCFGNKRKGENSYACTWHQVGILPAGCSNAVNSRASDNSDTAENQQLTSLLMNFLTLSRDLTFVIV